MTIGRDVWYHDAVDSCADECDVEWVDAETPLFMLYTSGSTGKPKGNLEAFSEFEEFHVYLFYLDCPILIGT